MTLRPPKALAPKGALKQDPLTVVLEHEVLAEKAATYGRLVQQLEKALARLHDDKSEETLNAAGQALWHVMVQRDLCGFRNHALFYKELKVPAAVRLRMGIARSR